MERTASLLSAGLFFICFGLMACTNENGAGGTVDGTDENNYELDHGHLAPPMDSVQQAAPMDTTRKDSAAAPAKPQP